MWLRSPPGRYLLAWERSQIDRAVADIFGYHALQVGLPQLDALRANRMPHRWRATDRLDDLPPCGSGVDDSGATIECAHAAADANEHAGDAVAPTTRPVPLGLHCDAEALPFPNNSLDLVVLPHALELAADPHLALSEATRVLVPGGRLVIVGFNPASLWGLRQRLGRTRHGLGGHGPLFLPEAGDFIGYWRLRDWLKLLSFDIEAGRFGCYRPPWNTDRWLDRWSWMEHAGDRWWPVLGAVYFLVAARRVHGMHLIGRVRKERVKAGAAPAVVAHRRR